MKSISAATWLVTLGLLLGAGSVQTRDGKTHDGDVRLDDGALLVRAAAGEEQRIEWSDVARAVLRSGAKADRAVGSATGGLPEGWKSQDVGGVSKPGSAACDAGGVFTIKASGWGAWGPDDSFHFVYRELEGDGQIIARVPKPTDGPSRMAAGVMIRESLAADAPVAAAIASVKGEVRLVRRPVQGAPTVKRSDDADAPIWLRLARQGDVFTAYRSRDGKQWEPVESKTIPIAKAALVGISGSTAVNALLDEVRVDSVLVAPGDAERTDFGDGAAAANRGVLLKDGNFVAGAIVSADASNIVLARAGGGDAARQETFTRDRVARLVFNPPPPGFLIEARPAGVLLANGDFIEGSISSLTARPATATAGPSVQVAVSSLLFGIRQVDAAREATAVVLAEASPRPAKYEVTTADGSIHRGTAVTIAKDGVHVDGEIIADVAEVKLLNASDARK